MNADNNGPAFPVYDHHGNGQKFLADAGLTLRDYFAAKAMQGLMAREGTVDVEYESRLAYRMADAMLKARATAHQGDKP